MNKDLANRITDIQSKVDSIEEIRKDNLAIHEKLDEVYELQNTIMDLLYKMRSSLNLINKSNISNYSSGPSGNIADFPRNAKEWIKTEMDKDMEEVLSWFEKYESYEPAKEKITKVKNIMGNKPGVSKKCSQLLWTFIIRNPEIKKEVAGWYAQVKKQHEENQQ